jgi:hypothetical protein
LINYLIELGFIQEFVKFLSIEIDSIEFFESCLPKIFSNPFLIPIPFRLLCDQNKHEPISCLTQSETGASNDRNSPVEILFENSQSLDLFVRLLTKSKSIQTSIVEILCCLCINNERQQQIVEKDFIQNIMHLLVQNNKVNLVR